MCGLVLKLWRYRIWQGLTRLRVGLGLLPVDLEAARKQLSAEEWRLFGALSPGDQEHAICVLRRVQRLPTASPALAKAALLHDVGKLGAGLTLGWRTLIVVFRGLGILERAVSQNPNFWRHPFYMHFHHAERGAQMCADAGCAPEVVSLVRWHDANPESVSDQTMRSDLAILQAADDAC